jgi:D-tyrosyl-tRNA(Tyr) deacylase
MRAVIQRVSEASVSIAGEIVSQVDAGLLVLLGIEEPDGPDDVEWLASKIVRIRIFSDAQGKMDLSVSDIRGSLLVVSQFTLHSSTKKGNRPSFLRAAGPSSSEPLYESFCTALERELGKSVGRGRFGANMQVAFVNDGPVTILIDSRARE